MYEFVLWKVERNVRYPDGIRYRLAFVRSGEEAPAILYDNHHPKGHHRHIEEREQRYDFVDARQLVTDFLADASALAGAIK